MIFTSNRNFSSEDSSKTGNCNEHELQTLVNRLNKWGSRFLNKCVRRSDASITCTGNLKIDAPIALMDNAH